MKVFSSGLANLLKGERSVKLACGITLHARKLTLQDLCDIEEVIISKRLDLRSALNTISESIDAIKKDDVKNSLLMGLSNGVEDILRTVGVVTLTEALQFEQSRVGFAWYLYLACRDKTPEFESWEDAYGLICLTSVDDEIEMRGLLEWSRQLEAVKNCDAPEVSDE